MILTAAAWITILLIGGLTNSVEQNFDTQLEYVLTARIASAEIGPDGEIRMNRPLGDQRFLEPNSGLYWQITGKNTTPFPSRSLWDRASFLGGDFGAFALADSRACELGGRWRADFRGSPLSCPNVALMVLRSK